MLAQRSRQRLAGHLRTRSASRLVREGAVGVANFGRSLKLYHKRTSALESQFSGVACAPRFPECAVQLERVCATDDINITWMKTPLHTHEMGHFIV